MYLHRLDLRAIGPYADDVTIDFASLAASGVFLLEGPTGSGKSTIIDAVVYALYGGLAGTEASTDRLHSQHADPSVEPFVELVFETGAGVFRVRRTPPYDRPKQRGSGTIRQQASAQLTRLANPADAIGEPMSHRAPEVGAEIARVVGLDRAQFLQTVVLPQGEFARFLRSPGEDRRKLLQSLFGTEVYDRIADELAARRRDAVAEVESADARVRDALGRFHQASGDDDVPEDGTDAVVAALQAVAVEHERTRSSAETAATAAVAHLHDVTARLAAVERRRDLLRRQDDLAAGAPTVAEARTASDRADRAAVVVALADGADTADARRVAAVAEHAALRAAAGPDDPDPRATHRRLADAVGAVRHLVDVERGIAGRRAAVEAVEADLDRLRARLDALTGALEARPDERAALVAVARAAADAASDAAAADRAVQDVAELRRTRADRVTATARVAAARARVGSAEAAARAALAVENDLRARRISGLAGELGAALEPGVPCPVCGSREHPAVATAQEDHPTPEQIASAEAARADAERRLSDASAEHAVAAAELARLDAAVGDLDDDELAARAEAAAARSTAAHTAAAAVAEHERRLTAFDAETRSLEDDRTDVATRCRVTADRIDGDRQRIVDDEHRVVMALTDLLAALPGTDGITGADGTTGADDTADGAATAGSALGSVAAQADQHAAALLALAEAADRVRDAERAAAERHAEVTAAVAEQGFADVAAARAAALPRREVERLRASVAAADRERAVVEAGLAEPEVVAAAADLAVLDRNLPVADAPGAVEPNAGAGADGSTRVPRLDLAAAREDRDRAAAALDDATRAVAAAAERARGAEQCAADLARALRARDATSARSRAVVRVADIAAAAPNANPTGITLGTYVLMRRFEDVVAAANDRLRAMLAGRFTLETSDERERGTRARRTGLALAVRDHTTDTTRDPRSLSGGETFTFSLCLALGLADVVQAEAGGVELGTLFVDEGFGTLDPETLDDVIGQLGRLTAGGRQVGIVSHVEELKQRIPERIAVRRTPQGGSRVTTTV